MLSELIQKLTAAGVRRFELDSSQKVPTSKTCQPMEVVHFSNTGVTGRNPLPSTDEVYSSGGST